MIPTHHLEALLEFLRFPSISTDSSCRDDMHACADWLAGRLRAAGLEAEIHPTGGHPAIIAKSAHRDGRPTVLIYGHYDVQPADPLDLWIHPPFEPHIENGIVFARGATDNKGQILAHVLGVAETLEAEGELPVNILFLIEGEEEIGSIHLEAFLLEHREELACDIAAVSDTGMLGRGIPTFTYGLRGIACAELLVQGPAQDLHSGIYGGAVANPATAVARLIHSLHDQKGRVAVPGFYDRVRSLESWEREAWESLPYGDSEILELTGAPELFGEQGFSSLERVWGRPTAEVNGIGGGYQGEGSKTVIPSISMAKLSFRLVPDQDPVETLELVRRHFESQCPPGIRIAFRPGHCGRPYLMDPHDPYGRAAANALESTFGRSPCFIREGGSIPIIRTIRDLLGANTLMLGLALPDCRAHSPNENFPLENFEAGIRLNRHLLAALAEPG
ncbi:MAG TPA: dipeptidase [Verrucomicrobiales bacterium]|nr:dipeptidase [Verrucomicrobiales bacterium]